MTHAAVAINFCRNWKFMQNFLRHISHLQPHVADTARVNEPSGQKILLEKPPS